MGLDEIREESIGLMEVVDEPLNEFQPADRERIRTRLTTYGRSALLLLQSVLWLGIPSFLDYRKSSAKPAVKLRPTAYLDGLRGVAAWAVFNTHLASMLNKRTGGHFGHPGGVDTELYKLPIIRLVYNGPFAVGLFFVISGYVLSVAPIAAMQKHPRDASSAMLRMSSAVFRRPLRLYLPSIVSMAIVFVLLRLNYFGSVLARQDEISEEVLGWPEIEKWPARAPTLFGQGPSLMSDMLQLVMVFTDDTAKSYRILYNPILWTIRREFRASLVLFATHYAVFYLKRTARLSLLVGLSVLAWAAESWDLPLFWFGQLLAELAQSPRTRDRPLTHWRSAIAWLSLLVGAFLGSYAAWLPQETPLWAWLYQVSPNAFTKDVRFWSGIGAVIVVSALSQIPVGIRFFCTRPIQYLGKLSFSFYLVHFWLVHGVGMLVFYYSYSLTGKANEFTALCGFLIGYILLFGLVIWVADIFMRAVDEPLVALSSRIQKTMFKEA